MGSIKQIISFSINHTSIPNKKWASRMIINYGNKVYFYLIKNIFLFLPKIKKAPENSAAFKYNYLREN